MDMDQLELAVIDSEIMDDTLYIPVVLSFLEKFTVGMK